MNENVNIDGSVDMQAEDWPSIPGNGNLPLNYDGRVPVRSSNGTMTAANLEFTFGWDSLSDEIYTVTLTAGTGGSITGASSGTYNYSTELNITAVPNSNYKFTKWSDNDANPNKTITVTSDINLSATFNTYQNLTRYNYNGINYDLKDDGTASVSKGTYSGPGTSGLSGNITISDTVVDNNGLSYTVTSIGKEAFNCSNLTSVIMPNSITSIGDYAFSSCHNLTSITMSNSLTSISEKAFSFCISLTSIVIPDSVTSIGNYAFEDCISLTSVDMGNSVTSIGIHAFDDCDALTNVTIPDSVISISDYAFRGCNALTSVDIGNSVTSIGKSVFNGCDDLTNVTILDSVTSIGSYAFNACNSLTDITIPDSVTYVGYNAFDNWESNQTINIEGKSSYQDTVDAGWDEDWNEGCNAQINYLG